MLLLVLGRLGRRRWVWVLGLGALLGMTPESIIYVSAVLGCLFLSDLLGGIFEPAAGGAGRAGFGICHRGS